MCQQTFCAKFKLPTAKYPASNMPVRRGSLSGSVEASPNSLDTTIQNRYLFMVLIFLFSQPEKLVGIDERGLISQTSHLSPVPKQQTNFNLEILVLGMGWTCNIYVNVLKCGRINCNQAALHSLSMTIILEQVCKFCKRSVTHISCISRQLVHSKK